MIQYSRKLLVVCVSLLFVAGLSDVASAREDVDDIISGALQYLDKYESGRIAFIYEMESSPRELTDRQVNEAVQDVEERFRAKGNFSEQRISEHVNKYRASMEKGRSKKNWTKISGRCEAIFDGSNQRLTNTLSDGRFSERYDYNGNFTIIGDAKTSVPGSTKPTLPVRMSYVYSTGCTNAEVHSILDMYRKIRGVLTGMDLVLWDTKTENGEEVYVLKDASHSAWDFFLEIVPEKGYYIKEFRRNSKKEPVWTTRKFSNPIWNADAQIYYPGRFVNERVNRFNPAMKATSRTTHTLTDVDLNIDVPEETFFVPMKDNLIVYDRRFDVGKTYSYSNPDELRRFLNELNGVAEGHPRFSQKTIR